MSSWRECKLGDIAEVIGGGTPKTSIAEYWNGNIPWLTPRDLTGYTKVYISHGERLITNDGLKSSSAKIMPKGTVLLTSRAPIGYVAIAENEVCTNQGFKSLVPNIEFLNSEFLYYWLKANIDYLQQLGTGTTFAEISGSVVKDIDIFLPPLEEQKAIAEVLSSFDDKIDLLHCQNKTLEDLAQTLFRQWFIEEAKEEWEIVTLGDLGKVVTGKTPSTNNEEYWGDDIPFITPTDFKNYNKYAFTSDRRLSFLGKDKVRNSVIPKNSILVTCIGSDMGKVVITQNECVTNQQINSLVLSNDNLLNEYVFQYLKSIYPLLRAIALGGTTMPIINKTDFENIEIGLPTHKILEEFQQLTSFSNKKIMQNTKQIQTLENLRDTLLPKLLSGEVRVKNA